MPRAAVSITTQATVEVKLKPELRQKLAPVVKTVDQLQAEIRRLTKKKKEKIAEIATIFKEGKQSSALAAGVEIDGVPVKLVCGTYKKLDQAALIELGCDPDWITEATEVKDKKPFIKVGKSERDEED